MSAGESPVVLFDGVCNLCNGTVAFAIARDPARRLRFAPFQSAPGRALLASFALSPEETESVVLIEDGRAYLKSRAALRLLRHLRRPWPWLALVGVLPRPLLDWLYDRVARNRYRLFGRREACMVPTADIAERFLA